MTKRSNQLSPKVKARAKLKSQLLTSLRIFFSAQGFTEVDTPILVKYPGTEPNLEVFETTLKQYGGGSAPAFLITSPEYALKKLLARGLGNCFALTKVFRNAEAPSPLHNPEFTLLEWYRVGVDYTAVMTDTERLMLKLLSVAQPRTEPPSFTYRGRRLDLTPPWPRYRLVDLFSRYLRIDATTLIHPQKLIASARALGYQVLPETMVDEVFNQLIENEIKPHLDAQARPYFLCDYPPYQAALARPVARDPRFFERFEVFIAGIELANCYSELNDATEQRRRIDKDLKERQRQGKTPFGRDETFIHAVSLLPPSAGIALGVDRLLMLLLDLPSIQDTLLFPIEELFFAE